MELIDYMKKFKELCNKIKKDLEDQVHLKAKEGINLTVCIDAGRKKAGEIRGEVKALLKEMDKHGDVKDGILLKLGELKKNLDDHMVAFDEDSLVMQRDKVNADIKKLQENIVIVTIE